MKTILWSFVAYIDRLLQYCCKYGIPLIRHYLLHVVGSYEMFGRSLSIS